MSAQDRCDECGLIFSRLKYASNKAAKEKIRHFDKDFVIYTKDLPSDVNWLKLLLLTFLTGLVGGHYYYVGKYLKGALMSSGFVYLIFCTIFNEQLVNALETTFAYVPIGILGLSWIVSLVYVGFRKFKVPVIVQMPDENAVVIGDIAIAKDEKKKENKQEAKKEEKKETIVEEKPVENKTEEPIPEKVEKKPKSPSRKYLGKTNTKRKTKK